MTNRQPGFHRRAPGLVVAPDGLRAECGAIVELSEDDDRLVVRLAGSPRFSVRLDVDAVRMLVAALRERVARAVPATHDIHGARLLCANPENRTGQPPWNERTDGHRSDPGPMVLFMDLPDTTIRVVFTGADLATLIDVLADGVDHISQRWSW